MYGGKQNWNGGVFECKNGGKRVDGREGQMKQRLIGGKEGEKEGLGRWLRSREERDKVGK